MTITILPKHLKGTSFNSIFNDPLMVAVKEQEPDLQPKMSFADYLVCKEKQYTNSGYSGSSLRKLKEGEIKELKVELKPL